MKKEWRLYRFKRKYLYGRRSKEKLYSYTFNANANVQGFVEELRETYNRNRNELVGRDNPIRHDDDLFALIVCDAHRLSVEASDDARSVAYESAETNSGRRMI